MAAPTPVSAYLHSATMVKAGVFLLTLLWPVLAGTEAWFYIVVSAGLCTLVLGAYAAIFQQDLKGLLAYSTISHLGLITLLLGLSSPLAAVAAIFHTINHATFKASLFMAAGIIDHESGTRDIRRLSGLFRFMPITATLAMVAAAAMAGVPLLNGFLSKEMFFAEAAAFHVDSLLDHSLPYFAMLASAFSVAYSLRFIHGVFFGPPATDLPRTPHEPPHWMRFPVEFLVLACLLVGVAPGDDHQALPRHGGARGPGPGYALLQPRDLARLQRAPAHERDRADRRHRPVLGVAGLPRRRASTALPWCGSLKGQRIFERVLVTLSWKWARSLERLFGTQRLQPQLRLLVGFAVLAALWPLYRHGLEAGSRPGTALRSRLPAALDRRRAVRHRRGLSGQVPPPRGHGPAGRSRARHLHHLRLVLGARPRHHPASRRDRHDGADPARPALAAEADRDGGRGTRRWACGPGCGAPGT